MSVSQRTIADSGPAHAAAATTRVHPQPLALPLAQRTRTPQASPRLAPTGSTASTASAVAAAVSPRAASVRRPILEDDRFELGPSIDAVTGVAGPLPSVIAVIPPSAPATPTSASASTSASTSGYAAPLAIARPLTPASPPGAVPLTVPRSASSTAPLTVHRPAPLVHLQDAALSGIGVSLSSPPRARLAAAAIGSPSASSSATSFFSSSSNPSMAASSTSLYAAVAASPFVGSLRSSMMSRLSELEDNDSADYHSTPEPGSGPRNSSILHSPTSNSSLLHSPTSSGGARSTWPAGNATHYVSNGRSTNGGVTGSSGGVSMVRSLSLNSAMSAACVPGSSPSPKERSRSAMLESSQVDAVRSALGLAFAPLMDAGAGSGSDLEVLASSPPPSSSSAAPPSFDFSDLRSFVQTPLPRGTQLCCTMYRDRSGSSFSSRRYPTYTLCAEDATMPPSQLELDGLLLPPPATAASATAAASPRLTLSAPAPAAPRRLRVLMYATKKSSSRYLFRVADPGDVPPEEAASLAAHIAAAACSTPTLSPLLMSGGGQHSPRSSSAATSECDPHATPSKDPSVPGGQADPNFLGSLLGNFIGNKYAFSAHTSPTAGAGAASNHKERKPSVQRTPSGSPSSSARGAASPLQLPPPSPHVVATLDGTSLSSFSSLAGPGGALSAGPFSVGSPSAGPFSGAISAASASGSVSSSHGLSTSGDVEIEYEINIFSRAPRHMSVLLPPLRASVADLLKNNAAMAAAAEGAESAGESVAASSLSVGASSPNPLRRLSSALSASLSPATGPRKSSSVSASCSSAAPLRLQSNAPRWNSLRGCHTLNFQGRAPVPSLKNFQLVRVDQGDIEAEATRKAGEQHRLPASATTAAGAAASACGDSALSKPPKSPVPASSSSPALSVHARLHPLTVQQQSPAASPRASHVAQPTPATITELPPSAVPSAPSGIASVSASVDSSRVVLQLGKAGPNAFHVDLRYPLTPLQAFAIVLSAFDYKIAVD